MSSDYTHMVVSDNQIRKASRKQSRPFLELLVLTFENAYSMPLEMLSTRKSTIQAVLVFGLLCMFAIVLLLMSFTFAEDYVKALIGLGVGVFLFWIRFLYSWVVAFNVYRNRVANAKPMAHVHGHYKRLCQLDVDLFLQKHENLLASLSSEVNSLPLGETRLQRNHIDSLKNNIAILKVYRKELREYKNELKLMVDSGCYDGARMKFLQGPIDVLCRNIDLLDDAYKEAKDCLETMYETELDFDGIYSNQTNKEQMQTNQHKTALSE